MSDVGAWHFNHYRQGSRFHVAMIVMIQHQSWRTVATGCFFTPLRYLAPANCTYATSAKSANSQINGWSVDDQLMISWWLERNCWVIWGCNGRNRRRALGQFGSRSSGRQLWNTTVSCHKKSALILKKCTFDTNKQILPNALVSANLELWSGLLLELATSKVHGEWRTCHAIHVSSGVTTPKPTMAHQSEFDMICDDFQIYYLISCDSNSFHMFPCCQWNGLTEHL